MKGYIKELREKCEQAEKDSAETLRHLIDKTTVVEKLKARMGLGNQLATLMQMQEDANEEQDQQQQQQNSNNNSNQVFDASDEFDEYDNEFMKMKEESEKNKHSRMIEELDKYTNAVDECKRNLSDKKKQVEHWRNRVDKACVERIRSFQNPPALIGQIIEIIIALIGKRKLLGLGDTGFSSNATPRIDQATNSQSNQVNDRQIYSQAENRPKISKFLLGLDSFRKCLILLL